ncbi:MAG TPA: hypothetical protein VFM71_09125 [Gemmatimonadaceae bacterium]|nr:hypothetical protein [Gemmatimonadaceae bacterium]
MADAGSPVKVMLCVSSVGFVNVTVPPMVTDTDDGTKERLRPPYSSPVEEAATFAVLDGVVGGAGLLGGSLSGGFSVDVGSEPPPPHAIANAVSAATKDKRGDRRTVIVMRIVMCSS